MPSQLGAVLAYFQNVTNFLNHYNHHKLASITDTIFFQLFFGFTPMYGFDYGSSFQ